MTRQSFLLAPLLAAGFVVVSACGGETTAPEPTQTPPAETSAPESGQDASADLETVSEDDTPGDDVASVPSDIQVESLDDVDLGATELGERAGGEAHVHGEAELVLVLDGTRAEMSFETPLESLLGFEYEPVTDAEQSAMSTLMLELQSATSIAIPSEGAACVTLDSDISILRDGDHATLVADYLLNCEDTDRMSDIDVGAVTRYDGLESVDVVIIGENGQAAGTVTDAETMFTFDL